MPLILESCWVVLAIIVVLRMRRAHREQVTQDATDRQAEAYYASAETLLAQRDHQAALTVLTRLLHTAPPGYRAMGLYRRAEAWLAAGHPENALRDASDLLGLRPFWAPGWALRADIHMAREDYDAARDSIRYALRLNPDLPQAQALNLALDAWFAQRAVDAHPATVRGV